MQNRRTQQRLSLKVQRTTWNAQRAVTQRRGTQRRGTCSAPPEAGLDPGAAGSRTAHVTPQRLPSTGRSLPTGAPHPRKETLQPVLPMHALRCPVLTGPGLPATGARSHSHSQRRVYGQQARSPGNSACSSPARQHPDPREARREGTFYKGGAAGSPTSDTAPGDSPFRTPGGPCSCEPAAGWRRAGGRRDRAPGTAGTAGTSRRCRSCRLESPGQTD